MQQQQQQQLQGQWQGQQQAGSQAVPARHAPVPQQDTAGNDASRVDGNNAAVCLPGSASDDVWHDVTAQPMRDPLNGEPLILLTQFDVTSRVAVGDQDAVV